MAIAHLLEKTKFVRCALLAVAILTVTGMSAGGLGQALAGTIAAANPPQNPYMIYGLVEQKGTHTPINGAAVWVNDSHNGVSLTAVTNAQGKYQQNLVNGTLPYSVGDNITVTAISPPLEGTNWTAVQNWTSVPPAGSWCNITMGVAPLSARISANPPTLFVGQQSTLSVVAAGGTPPYTYSWTFGDGSASVPTIINSTSHTYSKIGMFKTNVSVTDSASTNVISSVQVDVLATPTLGLSFVPALPQAGTNVTFHSALSLAGKGWKYFVAFGDGTNSGYLASGVDPMHSYAYKGNYTANSTAYNISSPYKVDSAPVNVPVGPGMAIGLSAGPSPTEVGRDTLFTANFSYSDSAIQYVFSFGDGTPSVGPQPSPEANHNYTVAGPETASVVGTNGTGVKASASVTLSVLPHVQVSWISRPSSGTQPHYVAVRAAASQGEGPYTYTISFAGTGYQSVFKNASGYANVTINRSGAFTASVQAIDALGVSAWATNLTFNITYVAPLVATIFGPSSGDVGVNMTFTLNFSGGVGPYTVTWHYGDGTVNGPVSGVTANSIVTYHEYNDASTYKLTAQVTDSLGHSVTATWSVLVSQAPGPGPTPILSGMVLPVYILLIVAVAIVLLLIFFLLWKRRKKKEEEEKTREAMDAMKAAAPAVTVVSTGVESQAAESPEPADTDASWNEDAK